MDKMSGLNKKEPSGDLESCRSNDLELDLDNGLANVFFTSQSSQLRLVEISLDQDQSEGNVHLMMYYSSWRHLLGVS